MPKITLLILILPLLFAPIALVLAQEAGLGTSTTNTYELPQSPANGLIKEWLIKGRLRAEVRTWMVDTQTRLEQAAGQALGSAQTAAKDEITKQAEQASQGLMEKAAAYADRGVAIIKGNIYLLISKIILFFNNLFAQG